MVKYPPKKLNKLDGEHPYPNKCLNKLRYVHFTLDNEKKNICGFFEEFEYCSCNKHCKFQLRVIPKPVKKTKKQIYIPVVKDYDDIDLFADQKVTNI